MAKIRPQVFACYQQFKSPGTLELVYVVASNGTVQSVAVGPAFAGTPTGHLRAAGREGRPLPAVQAGPAEVHLPVLPAAVASPRPRSPAGMNVRGGLLGRRGERRSSGPAEGLLVRGRGLRRGSSNQNSAPSPGLRRARRSVRRAPRPGGARSPGPGPARARWSPRRARRDRRPEAADSGGQPRARVLAPRSGRGRRARATRTSTSRRGLLAHVLDRVAEQVGQQAGQHAARAAHGQRRRGSDVTVSVIPARPRAARSSSTTPSTTSATARSRPRTGRAPACANANRSSIRLRARAEAAPRPAPPAPSSARCPPRRARSPPATSRPPQIGFSRSCATRPAKPSSSSDRRRTIASLP